MTDEELSIMYDIVGIRCISSEHIIDQEGTEFWVKHGLIHREDGPAVIYITGTRYWCRYGKYHRTDGPAIEYNYGSEFWFINGVKISDFKELQDRTGMSDEELIILKLKYGYIK